jgi:hypothetical protein
VESEWENGLGGLGGWKGMFHFIAKVVYTFEKSYAASF